MMIGQIFLDGVRRLPVTSSLLAALAAVALFTNSFSQRLSPAWLLRLGYSVQDLWEWRWGRLLTTALTTHGGSVFWQAMGMVALAVGAAEWLAGSRRAFFTFWGSHVATLLLTSLLVMPALHWLVYDGESMLLVAHDVGPSAGYFGCLGLAVVWLPLAARWRGVTAVLIWTGLVITLLQPPAPGALHTLKLIADLAHLVAFPLGLLAGWWLARQPVTPWAQQRGPA